MAGDSKRLPLRVSRRARWELDMAVVNDMLEKLESNYWNRAESWRNGMLKHWRAERDRLLSIEPPKEQLK
jgi:hypothetical protein